jgi:hypothetical protein
MTAMGCYILRLPAVAPAFSERGRYDIDLQLPDGGKMFVGSPVLFA